MGGSEEENRKKELEIAGIGAYSVKGKLRKLRAVHGVQCLESKKRRKAGEKL